MSWSNLPRPHESGIQHVRPVRGPHEQNVPVPLGRLSAEELRRLRAQALDGSSHPESVHLVEKTRESAGAAHPEHASHAAHPAAGPGPAAPAHDAAAGSPDRIDLVDIRDGRPVPPRHLARLADEPHHLQRVHSPEHVAEPRSLHRDERHAGFSRHGLGEHGLPGARLAVQQQAVDVATAHPHEHFTVREEAQPLPHEGLQVRLSPVVVEGDHLGIFRPYTLHTGARHEPEDGDELDEGDEDAEGELPDEVQREEKGIQDRRVEVEQDADTHDDQERSQTLEKNQQAAEGILAAAQRLAAPALEVRHTGTHELLPAVARLGGKGLARRFRETAHFHLLRP